MACCSMPIRAFSQAAGPDTTRHSTVAGLVTKLALTAAALFSGAAIVPAGASAGEHRSRASSSGSNPAPRRADERPVPGCWRDHIVPLACGGPDASLEQAMADDRGSAGKDA